MSSISIRLPDSLHEATRKLAKQEHISINQFITLAVSEKISALGTEALLEERAKRANRNKFLHVLNNVPDVEPDIEDQL